MRTKLVVLMLLVPAFAMGQSLAELAKKEKERRDKNKAQGTKVRVISEEELTPETPPGAESAEAAEGEAPAQAPARPRPSTPTASEIEQAEREAELDELERGQAAHRGSVVRVQILRGLSPGDRRAYALAGLSAARGLDLDAAELYAQRLLAQLQLAVIPAPEPAAGLALASGVALCTALARRRRC